MKILGYLASLLLIASCAGASISNSVGQVNEYPDSWPQLVVDYPDGEGCPNIDGIYSSGGQSNSTIGERFSNPIFERSFFYLDEIADRSNFFKVRKIAEGKELMFQIFNPERVLLATGLHKQVSKCENGWYVIESLVKGGSGDSPVISSYSRTRFGKAEDEALLVNSYAEGVSSKWIFGRETQVSNIWYRFDAHK